MGGAISTSHHADTGVIAVSSELTLTANLLEDEIHRTGQCTGHRRGFAHLPVTAPQV
jgi:hypothetical protein